MTSPAIDTRPRILLVDDHEENLLALEAVLSDPHYALVRANSGRAALRAALQGDFAVILLDVAMPDMDGFETAALLRERDRSRRTPIIFLTANYRSEGHVFRGYSVGAVDYLLKPFSPEVLRSKVAVFVELFETTEALTRRTEELQRVQRELEDRVRERTEALQIANRVERELRAQAEQANRLKDEFLATLSHELRTPLNAILGWTHLLTLPSTDPAMTERAIAVIKNNAIAQSQIIEDILDVSRIVGGKLRLRITPASAKEIVEAAIDAMLPAAEAKAIAIERDLCDIGAIEVDRDRLQQVCWNLLSNAVKFTPKGGRVGVRLFEQDDDLVLVVEDSGIGIAPEFLPFLFDRFTQADSSARRRHGGLGVGMAIVRHLVELHGGTVKVESEGLNRGATFTVVLPRRPADALGRTPPSGPFAKTQASTATGADPPLPSLHGRHLLVVDDDEDTVQTIGALLRNAGARVSLATSGSAALEILQHEHIDVLLSDLEMPEIDGLELARRVRQLPKGRQMPVIAVSAHTRPDEAAAALSAGYDLHVAKPVEMPQLVTAIDTLASLKSTANGVSREHGQEP
jgi:signal transduction histidine kinase